MTVYTIDSIQKLSNKNNCNLLSTKYINSNSKLLFNCSCGIQFEKSLRNFIDGPRCRECYLRELRKTLSFRNKILSNNMKLPISKVKLYIENAGYQLLSTDYINNRTNLKLKCSNAHEYLASFGSFRNNRRCPVCATQYRADLCRKPFEEVKEFIEFYKYTIVGGEYVNERSKLLVCCPNKHEYVVCFNSFQQGCRCPKCNKSKVEEELRGFINGLNVVSVYNSKLIIPPYEIDIYLPDLKVGIEYHGVYWHSDKFRESIYHKLKADEADKKGIRLIQIFEDEWLNKRDVVERIIKSVLKVDDNKIYARKCEIIEVFYNEAKKFLNLNHVQGAGNVGKVRLGLRYDNKLVSLMTFSKPSISKNYRNIDVDVWELYKQCFSIRVVGGFSRLLKYFVNKYKSKRIISYVDRRYFTANSYLKCGFKVLSHTTPNYFYVVGGIRKHRFNFRKDKLVKLGYDKNKTEKQITSEMGLCRIYDAGHIKLELKEDIS